MINVLFVCLGNICRSPMAEAVFRSELAKRGLQDRIAADSAGTGDWHIGKPPHEGTRKLLDRYGISYAGMLARQVTAGDFASFDYIVAMDRANERDLMALLPKAADPANKARIVKLLDLIPGSPTLDVPDPYYTGNFDEVYELVAAGCDRLIDLILREHANALQA